MAQPTDQGTQVHITPLTEPDALVHQYPRENGPQPTHLALDLEDGELTASYNPAIGSVHPMAVHHRRTLWFSIPCLTANAANALMEEVKPLAQRIVDGATIKSDGENLVGVLDGDAQAACDELADRCDPDNWEPGDMAEEIDARTWYGGISTSEVIAQFELTADTPDAEIEAKARQAEEEAKTAGEPGYLALTGVEEYLTAVRDDLRSELYDKLAEVVEHIADLTEKRDYLISQIRGWNSLSDRQIAVTADMSHTQVRLIDEKIRKAHSEPNPGKK